MPSRLPSPLIYTAGFTLAATVLTLFAYWPGLSGNFLFDDFANINALGATGPVDNWNTFWRYITSGTADPTGRPVALLSFLIDGNNWPTDPHPFKRTNLILHLVNGLLLGAALWRLGLMLTAPEQRKNATLAAALGAALWLLHPLMVSTTLYIVQRQAMLPATFLLLALHGWLSGRLLVEQGSKLSGSACMVLSIGGGTALAVLSKGNGILLPALVGVIELIILRRAPAPATTQRVLNIVSMLVLLAPALIVLTYLLTRIPGVAEATPHFRPWTLGQRLLTEPRIVLDYLALLLVPRPFTAGLYNDNILVSTSLLSPWTTLPAIGIVLGMPVVAWTARKRYPLAATAILFYWIGHLVESSVLALELYYEHRNYLPAMFLFWPLAWWLTQPGQHLKPRLIVSGALVIALTGMTHARANLWGNDREQALVWAALNPDSPRAQTTAALHEMHINRPDLAHRRLAALESSMANEIQIAFNRIGASCRMGALLPGDLQAAHNALRTAKRGSNLTFKWMDRMVSAAGRCRGFDLQEIDSLVEAAKGNPKLHGGPGRQQEFLHLEARIALIRKDPSLALAKFNQALQLQIRPAAALEQAAALGRAGHPDYGLQHLEFYDSIKHQQQKPRSGMPQIHAWVLSRQEYWTHEEKRLRKTLADDSTIHTNP